MSYQAWSVTFAEQPSTSKWNILGTNDAEFNSLIQRDSTGYKTLDSNGNEVIKGAVGSASAVNEITVTNAATGSYPIISASGGDTNSDISITPKGTGIFRVGAYPEWYQEIGRTTLTGAADTISLTSLPARAYLKILFKGIATGGTLDSNIRFNNDSGTTYAWQGINGAALSSSFSGTGMPADGGTVPSGGQELFEATISNVTSQEKVGLFAAVNPNVAGGANIPTVLSGVFKWANTSAQINRVDAINGGTGDFATGSEIIVLGHD